MTSISVKLDLKPLGNALMFMSTQQREFAMRDALNRAMDGMFTTAKRGIAREANIAIGDIARAMRKIPSSGGLSAEVRVTDRWYPGGYRQFRARQGSSGASFTPWKGHTQHVPHGFIATMKTGHVSVFVRMGKTRLKIEDVGWGPNPAREMVRDDKPTRVEVQAVAQARFQARFEYQYNRIVDQAKARYGL